MAITFIGQIKEALRTITLSGDNFKGSDEPKITKYIFNHLKKNGLKVTNEKQIGFLKFYIDIDYRDGNAGIEIKLAEKLVNDTGNSGEIQRLFGQTYYYTQNYKSNIIPIVLIVVVGEENYRKDPKMIEIKKYIKKMGAEFEYISYS